MLPCKGHAKPKQCVLVRMLPASMGMQACNVICCWLQTRVLLLHVTTESATGSSAEELCYLARRCFWRGVLLPSSVSLGFCLSSLDFTLPVTSALECAIQGRDLGVLGKNQVSEWSREQRACSRWTFS